MTDKIKEQLSALVDGELPDSERELLLRRMETDEDLRKTWRRYNLVHDVLHRNLPQHVDSGFTDRVMTAIADEDLVAPPLAVHVRKFLRPLAGLAIAASVAALAIIGIQNFGVTTSDSDISIATGSKPDSGFRQVSGTRWDTKQPGVDARLNGYLVNHNEYSSATSLQGILQYRRIVGYDASADGK